MTNIQHTEPTVQSESRRNTHRLIDAMRKLRPGDVMLGLCAEMGGFDHSQSPVDQAARIEQRLMELREALGAYCIDGGEGENGPTESEPDLCVPFEEARHA
jgi:hypothetical protein